MKNRVQNIFCLIACAFLQINSMDTPHINEQASNDLLTLISQKSIDYDAVYDVLDTPGVNITKYVDPLTKKSVLHYAFQLPESKDNLTLLRVICSEAKRGWSTPDSNNKTPLDYFQPFSRHFAIADVIVTSAYCANKYETANHLNQWLFDAVDLTHSPEINKKFVRKLLEYTADPGKTMDELGNTAIHKLLASTSEPEQEDIVAEILDHANPEAFVVENKMGLTPIAYLRPGSKHQAFTKRIIKKVRTGLAHDPEKRELLFGSLFNRTLSQDDVETKIKGITALLENKVWPTDHKDVFGKTALHHLMSLEIDKKSKQLVDLVMPYITVGWDIPDLNGDTPAYLFDPINKHKACSFTILQSIIEGYKGDTIAGKFHPWLLELFNPNNPERIRIHLIKKVFALTYKPWRAQDEDGNTIAHRYFQIKAPEHPQELTAETKSICRENERQLKKEARCMQSLLQQRPLDNWQAINNHGLTPLDYFDPTNNKHIAPMLLKETLGKPSFAYIKTKLAGALVHALKINDLKLAEQLMLYGLDPLTAVDDSGNTAAHLFFKNAHISEDSVEQWQKTRKRYPKVAHLLISHVNRHQAWNKKNKDGQTIFSYFNPEKDSNNLTAAAQDLIKEQVIHGAFQQIIKELKTINRNFSTHECDFSLEEKNKMSRSYF